MRPGNDARDQVTTEILSDDGMRDGLKSLGYDHENLLPLVEAYVQFLVHGPKSRLEPELAVRAVWKAHRSSPDFPRFAQAHPDFVPVPSPEVFERISYPDYGRLYTQVAIGEDHLDDTLWPDPYRIRFLGLTDRQAGWLYAATFLLSAWSVYQVYSGSYSGQILVLIPLFLAFAYARFRQGRVREIFATITSQTTAQALQEAASARSLSSYKTGARRRRKIILGSSSYGVDDPV